MSNSSLIADVLTRIRNAQMARHTSVVVQCSNFVKSCLSVLKNEGYIVDFEEFEERKGIKFVNIALKYYRGKSVINMIRLVSKPGRRFYVNVESMPKSLNGLGVYVVSTSKGVMSDKLARENILGGELLFEVH